MTGLYAGAGPMMGLISQSQMTGKRRPPLASARSPSRNCMKLGVAS